MGYCNCLCWDFKVPFQSPVCAQWHLATLKHHNLMAWCLVSLVITQKYALHTVDENQLWAREIWFGTLNRGIDPKHWIAIAVRVSSDLTGWLRVYLFVCDNLLRCRWYDRLSLGTSWVQGIEKFRRCKDHNSRDNSRAITGKIRTDLLSIRECQRQRWNNNNLNAWSSIYDIGAVAVSRAAGALLAVVVSTCRQLCSLFLFHI